MRKRSRGITVSELMVTCMILGLLGLLTVVLFRTGASGWKKMEAQSGLLADYEVFNEKITREVQRSTYDSASVVPDATQGDTFSFLSALDDTGTFVINEDLDPQWQKYLIFYWDKPNQRLYMTHEKLPDDSAQIDVPAPLPTYDYFTGDMTSYRTGGRLLMANVDICNFELSDFMVTISIGAQKKRYGDEAPETLNMVNSIAFRN